MPTYKVLAQSAPAATTATTLLTATSATIVSTLNASNIGATQDTIRIAVRPAGASLANQHYIAFDVTVGGSDSTIITIGATLDATDVITVRASTSNVSFTAFGSEIS